ncbi:uncharacterized protein ACB058_003480 [Synchiropus picturatus]
MDQFWLLTLFLSYMAVDAWPRRADKPTILLSDDEIKDGDMMTITCLVPIDYGGGTCSLYRKHSNFPFRQVTADRYTCKFHLTSSELLGPRPVSREVRFKCDYTLQEYISAFSQYAVLEVWGSRPSPSLSVGRHVVSLKDTVEVNCPPPPPESSHRCDFYRDQYRIKSASCHYNITGNELVIWEKPAVLTPVNFTCRNRPEEYVRSEPSNHHMMFVVDAAQATTSMVCRVSVEHGEGEWVFDGDNKRTVTVRASSSDQQADNTCIAVPDQTSLGESAPGP